MNTRSVYYHHSREILNNVTDETVLPLSHPLLVYHCGCPVLLRGWEENRVYFYIGVTG